VAGEQWTIEALTSRIEAIDPTGPVIEAGSALRGLHRQLVAALGDHEARDRFDRALAAALTRQPGSLVAR
jgi:hypothetical protein